jgi:hypothetical protein
MIARTTATMARMTGKDNNNGKDNDSEDDDGNGKDNQQGR